MNIFGEESSSSSSVISGGNSGGGGGNSGGGGGVVVVPSVLTDIQSISFQSNDLKIANSTLTSNNLIVKSINSLTNNMEVNLSNVDINVDLNVDGKMTIDSKAITCLKPLSLLNDEVKLTKITGDTLNINENIIISQTAIDINLPTTIHSLQVDNDLVVLDNVNCNSLSTIGNITSKTIYCDKVITNVPNSIPNEPDHPTDNRHTDPVNPDTKQNYTEITVSGTSSNLLKKIAASYDGKFLVIANTPDNKIWLYIRNASNTAYEIKESYTDTVDNQYGSSIAFSGNKLLVANDSFIDIFSMASSPYLNAPTYTINNLFNPKFNKQPSFPITDSSGTYTLFSLCDESKIQVYRYPSTLLRTVDITGYDVYENGLASSNSGIFTIAGIHEDNNSNTGKIILFKNHLSSLASENKVWELTSLETKGYTFGSAVGVREIPGTEYPFIAIGSPNHGSQGRVYFYDTRDIVNETLFLQDESMNPPDNSTDIIRFGQNVKFFNNYLYVVAEKVSGNGAIFIYTNYNNDPYTPFKLVENYTPFDVYFNDIPMNGYGQSLAITSERNLILSSKSNRVVVIAPTATTNSTYSNQYHLQSSSSTTPQVIVNETATTFNTPIKVNEIQNSDEKKCMYFDTKGNTYISNDLYVNGNTNIVDTNQINVLDNEIVLNGGLSNTAAPPTNLTSGIVVNRGSQPDYRFQFDELTQSFRIGLPTDLQAVMTRSDTLTHLGIPQWDDTQKKMINGLSAITTSSLANIGSLDITNTQWAKINDLDTASNYVKLTGSQTLLNKTLTSPTISGGLMTGTISGSKTFSGQTTFSAPVRFTNTYFNNTANDNIFFPSGLGDVTLATTTGAETLFNKTLSAPIISTISNTGLLTLPTSTDTLIGRATTDTLTNKTLTLPVISSLINGSGNTISFPTASGTLISATGTATLSNKTLTNPTINSATLSGTLAGTPTFSNSIILTNPTINSASFSGSITGDFSFSNVITFSNQALFSLNAIYRSNGAVLYLPASSGAIATTDRVETFINKTLTTPIISSISNTGLLTLPTTTDTLIGRDTIDTLTNKTLTSATINNPTLAGNIAGTPTFLNQAIFSTSPKLSTDSITTSLNNLLTLPTSIDTLIGRNTTDTLTNKTLTQPIISTISNTGLLTLPTTTDRLVGRATIDTLTNKTLTQPIISIIQNGANGLLNLAAPGSGNTDTLVARATTDTLTNKTLTNPTINAATISGTLTGTPTFSNLITFTSAPQLNSNSIKNSNGNTIVIPSSISTLSTLDLPETITAVKSFNSTPIFQTNQISGDSGNNISLPSSTSTLSTIQLDESLTGNKTFTKKINLPKTGNINPEFNILGTTISKSTDTYTLSSSTAVRWAYDTNNMITIDSTDTSLDYEEYFDATVTAITAGELVMGFIRYDLATTANSTISMGGGVAWTIIVSPTSVLSYQYGGTSYTQTGKVCNVNDTIRCSINAKTGVMKGYLLRNGADILDQTQYTFTVPNSTIICPFFGDNNTTSSSCTFNILKELSINNCYLNSAISSSANEIIVSKGQQNIQGLKNFNKMKFYNAVETFPSQNLTYYLEGQITLTFQNAFFNPGKTMAINYVRIGRITTLSAPGILAAIDIKNNAINLASLTPLPASVRPVNRESIVVKWVVNNVPTEWVSCFIETNGNITITTLTESANLTLGTVSLIHGFKAFSCSYVSA